MSNLAMSVDERELRVDIIKILFIPTIFAIVFIPTILLFIMIKIYIPKHILRILWSTCVTVIYGIYGISYLYFSKIVKNKYRNNIKALKMLRLGKLGITVLGIAIIALWIVVLI